MERRADRRPRLPALDGMSWAIVDVSNFYVSAERLFDPSLSPRSTSCARRWRGSCASGRKDTSARAGGEPIDRVRAWVSIPCQPTIGVAIGAAISPINDPRVIIGIAAKMMEAMFQPGGVYTKCGVLLEDLTPEGQGRLTSSQCRTQRHRHC